jgi:hypothetical protein
LVTLFVPVVLFAASAGAQKADEAAVRAAVNQYLRGHATGSGDEMRKAFLPTAHIEGIRDGRFVSWTVDEYVSRFSGKPAADEAARKRTIDHLDVSGTAAMARATLVHGRTTFVDYFVLLEVDGQWKIANKVYSAAPTSNLQLPPPDPSTTPQTRFRERRDTTAFDGHPQKAGCRGPCPGSGIP